ncbi:diguanylate cyclase [Rhizobium sp. S95]|uniref:diguanylate cyclase n=1 Tax=Ciceribacter sichuanensis TaxID=2949647 RepID=A0AAJ1BW46_9HYPH|nr:MULTISPECIES: diguanylate cyclase [unclassified Ciceribacter]MCM2396520.1 diguanylate cyclase [Ciceribacter sp. S95]MCO5957329.1 diguanylate cyclase [Ciceribacter sp. S101]
MNLEGTKKIVIAALLLPSLIMAAEAVLLLRNYYHSYRDFAAGKHYAYIASDAGNIGSSVIPDEARATLVFLADRSNENHSKLAARRFDVDTRFDRFLAFLAEAAKTQPSFDARIRGFWQAAEHLKAFRDSVDQGTARPEQVIGQYKPASMAFLELVTSLRYEIADPALSRQLSLLIDILDANEAGLVVSFYGTEHFRGLRLSDQDRETFNQALALLNVTVGRFSAFPDSAAIKPIDDFARSLDGRWLARTAHEIATGDATPSRLMLRRWSQLQNERIQLWQDSIRSVVEETRASGDALALRSRFFLEMLVGATVVFSLLVGVVILLAVKGVALADRLIRDRELLVSELRNAAQTDLLTGLYNRRGFDAATTSLLRGESGSSALSMVIFDLDRFKQINDAHGHDVGDMVLQRVAQVAQSSFRTQDLLSRHGGEEFVALLPDTSLDEAATIAERVRATIEATEIRLADGTALTVTASFGCSGTEDENVRGAINELIKKADLALYAAKFSGRNRVVIDGEADMPTVERRNSQKT